MTSTLTVDIFLSVDGWAGSDGLPGYFGYFGPELGEWITSELEKPQLAVMGRRTYQVLAGLPDEARDASWRRMTELDKVVFSRTLQQADWANTRICDRDLVDEIARLKSESDVPLRTLGSLSVGRQLIDAGLADRVRLMTFPLLAGSDGAKLPSRTSPRPTSSWSTTAPWTAGSCWSSTDRPAGTSPGPESRARRPARPPRRHIPS